MEIGNRKGPLRLTDRSSQLLAAPRLGFSMTSTFNPQSHTLMPSRPRSFTATLRGLSVYPAASQLAVFSPASRCVVNFMLTDLGSR